MGCLRNDYIKEGLKLGINYIIGGTIFVVPIAVSAMFDLLGIETSIDKYDVTVTAFGICGMLLVVAGIISM